MIVVADTSPLNYLIRLGHVEILTKLYGRVLIPNAVLNELRHPNAPSKVRSWAANPPAWLERTHVKNLDKSLTKDIDAGECEAISLALELHADVLLIDERIGREEAKARKIFVAGTLATLLRASLRGYLNFPEELDRLHDYGFRASVSLEALMLAEYNQSKK